MTADANGNAYLAGGTLLNNLPANGLQTTRKGNSIYKSNDKAATWTATGAGINSVTFNGLVFDPITPANVYASTLQGLYKSTDGGNQWQHLNSGFFSTYAIAINPVTPATLYAGTDFGVFKSTDSGTTWQLKNNGFQSFVPTIVVHPQTPQTVFAGTRDGMFKSVYGAETWTALNNGMLFPQYGTQPPPVNKVLMDRTNPQILYAAIQRGFFKTIDGGANWTKAQSGLPVSGSDPNISNAFADPSNVNTLYALLSTPTAGLYKTTDGGANWNLATANIPVNVAGQTVTFPLGTIAIDPASSATIYATSSGNGVFKSTDGGQSWAQKIPVF